MLQEVRISGLGVIAEAVFQPHPGFTVVTGETGAGKTMVVTALGLAGGGRADAARVRAGADRAVVETRWQPRADQPAVVAAVQEAGGHLDDDGSLICVRTVSAEGRSRAHVGGRSVPLTVLTEVTEPMLTVHGQSEAIALLRPAAQRAVLDRFAGCDAALAGYQLAREDWHQAREALAEHGRRTRERAQREHLLQTGLAEIDALAPRPGEDRQLIDTVRRLENAEALRAAARQAQHDLVGDDADPEGAHALGLLESARKALAGSEDRTLREMSEQLPALTAVTGDLAAGLSSYLADLDADPGRLEETLARQAALKTLTRRYGAEIDDVLQWAEQARAELDSLASSEHDLAALEAKVVALQQDLLKAGNALSAQRRAGAEQLAQRANAELAHLAMGRAALRIDVRPRPVVDAAWAVTNDGEQVQAGASGFDQVEILLTAHTGAPELPIAKGASGGELSRVMLALEVVLASADTVSTLVFDEVDAGVGGRAATEIGRRLAGLARSHQVIVVTHLAQVAAFADRHYVVDAAADGTVGSSALTEVQQSDRLAELARMLGGTDTDTAKAHAADLLATAAAG